jgi:hypothetical protein
MPQVQCSYCGLPFKVRQIAAGRAQFCCSGCALASRLPTADASGQFPVTAGLVAALGMGFAFFNEVLGWTLAMALTREHRATIALIFARISVGLGLLVWATLAAGIGRAPARRWSDAALALATLAFIVIAISPPFSAGGVVAANATLGLWLARGWGRKKFARKLSLTV